MDTDLYDLGIDFVTPSNPHWNLFSVTYNSRVPVIPAIVIVPATVEQVSQAVRCAASHGLKVQARSGGHSYASHSNGGTDGSAVVDLRKFQTLRILEAGIVVVDGGVRLGNLATAIFNTGTRALAHGTCPAVGVGGHFTHGGFGMQSRAWGLAMDQIVGLDVVMANGQVISASKSVNKDIFESMCGAADSFGIVVKFYLRTQPAPKVIVKWTIDMPEAVTSIKSATDTFNSIQEFVNNPQIIDRRLGLVIFLKHDRFTLEGTYLGSMSEFLAGILSEFLRRFDHQRNIEVKFRELGWLELLRALAGTDLKVGSDVSDHQCFFAKSVVVANPGVHQDRLEAYFLHLLGNGAGTPIDYFIGVQLYGGADSQITANTERDSFGHRNAMWVFQHYGSVRDGFGSTDFPEEGIRFLEGLNKALGPECGASKNYADPSLNRADALELFYGRKLHRLSLMKGLLDPTNVFFHPQSILPMVIE
ncbi:Glucooligosaccharide oxidase [Xylaria telfairii]|nr:Glucooligosaccharide oxidase [Xylaria telfairii]